MGGFGGGCVPLGKKKRAKHLEYRCYLMTCRVNGTEPRVVWGLTQYNTYMVGSFGSLVGPAQIPIHFSLSIWAGLIARLLSMSCRVLLASA